jgi:hypothetical protein
MIIINVVFSVIALVALIAFGGGLVHHKSLKHDETFKEKMVHIFIVFLVCIVFIFLINM